MLEAAALNVIRIFFAMEKKARRRMELSVRTCQRKPETRRFGYKIPVKGRTGVLGQLAANGILHILSVQQDQWCDFLPTVSTCGTQHPQARSWVHRRTTSSHVSCENTRQQPWIKRNLDVNKSSNYSEVAVAVHVTITLCFLSLFFCLCLCCYVTRIYSKYLKSYNFYFLTHFCHRT